MRSSRLQCHYYQTGIDKVEQRIWMITDFFEFATTPHREACADLYQHRLFALARRYILISHFLCRHQTAMHDLPSFGIE